MKKILIIGGNGFIGKNLIEYLSRDYNIYSPNREELDLLDEGMVEKYLDLHRFDIVIHSAIQNTLGEFKIFETESLDRNLRMFFNIERCNDKFGKMYFFGSGAEYNKENKISNASEELFGRTVPKEPYGFSKYIMSKSIENKENIFNLRLFGIFGRYEKWEFRFVSNSIYRVINNLPIKINQNVYFDYLYIDDLCKIMLWFIENKPKYKYYNLCTGTKIDLVTIAKIIIKESKKQIDIIVSNEGLSNEYTGNNVRLINEIGDFKYTPIEEAIKELYNYCLNTNEQINIKSLTK